MRLLNHALTLAIGCLLLGLTMACGSAAHVASSGVSLSSPAATAGTVKVSGTVARSCLGPIIVGRPQRCSDRAVFTRGHRRVTVRGKFRVRLAPGTYHVTVDSCTNNQTLHIKHAISGLKLVPRCPLPL